MTPDLTERQEAALRFVALCDRRSYADVKRQAISDYADQLLADPLIAGAVRNVMRYRREHGIHRPVTVLRSIR